MQKGGTTSATNVGNYTLTVTHQTFHIFTNYVSSNGYNWSINYRPLVFDPNYSGKANIYLNGAFLGFSEDFLKEKYDEIVDFSELKEFLDVPVKNFSSGMVARLGFAIATMNIPDILIIDEILAVGDYKFQQKSFQRMQEMIDSGATVVFVSHSVEQVKKICKKALWLEHGNVVKFGSAEEVCAEYMNS